MSINTLHKGDDDDGGGDNNNNSTMQDFPRQEYSRRVGQVISCVYRTQGFITVVTKAHN
jgi:hypothetical protein